MREAIETINHFIGPYAGVAQNMLDSIFDGEMDATREQFFKPYASKSNLFFRAASVVIAPVVGGIYALEGVVMALYAIFKGIVDLVAGNSRQAWEDLGGAAIAVLGMIVGAVFAVLSPVINLVDLVGSGVTSLLPADSDSDSDSGDEYDDEVEMPPSPSFP